MATVFEAMLAIDDADAPLDPSVIAPAPAKPTLALMLSAGFRLLAWLGQNDALDFQSFCRASLSGECTPRSALACQGG